MNSSSGARRIGMTLIAAFCIISGLAEISVGFRGNFLGILSNDLQPNTAVGVVGSLYALGGLFLLTNRKWGAVLGLLFIAGEILGRVYLVATGVAASQGADLVKVIVGGAIAFAIVVYIWSRLKAFG